MIIQAIGSAFSFARILSVVALAWSVGAATAAGVGQANSLRSALLADASDGSLDEFSLSQAALIAGRDLEQREYELAGRKLSQIVSASVRAAAKVDAEKRGVELFRFMHREVLRGEYRSGQNDLTRLLETGDYNCVTATILYQTLCRASAAPTRAVAAPAHVFCRLDADLGGDVETTCPTWFEQAQRKNPRAGRVVSDVQLVGKIFYNRGVYFLEHERFSQALEQLDVSLQFDKQDRTAQSNRLAAYNNWALAKVHANQFAEAIELLGRGMAIDSSYGPFLANDLHIHQRWVNDLCENRREDEAVRLLLQRRGERPEEPLYRDGPIAIYRHWLDRLARDGDWRSDLSQVVAVRHLLSDSNRLLREEREALGIDGASEIASCLLSE